MANTYHQLYVQAVFAVKYRKAIIQKSWRSDFLAVIGNQINDTGCKTIIVNGVEDHVHCFFHLAPTIAISDVMQKVKSKSSGWLNRQKLLDSTFEWQTGYGAFSYSKAHVDNLYHYILNQEQHHKKQSFKVEYLEMLKEYGVAYDEQYLFHDLI